MATVSFATVSQSRTNVVACGSRKTNRALLGGAFGVGVDGSEQRPCQGVRTKDLEATAEDHGGCAVHGVHQALDGRTEWPGSRRRAAWGPSLCAGGAEQVD
jgi:hypothetical protein